MALSSVLRSATNRSLSLGLAQVVASDQPPSQEQFLRHELVPSATDTVLPSSGTECGVCLQELDVPARPFGPGTRSTVVFLKPCTHFFHRECIVTWHTSCRPERDTCPICRRVLFVAEPLTPAQIQRLHSLEAGGEASRPGEPSQRLHSNGRPIGPYRQPGPDEELLIWEGYTMDMEARRAVRQEIYRVLISGGKHCWLQVSKDVRDAVLAAGGTLRPVFEPHRETFVLLVHALSVLVVVSSNHEAIRDRAFVKFNKWIDEMENKLTTASMMDLNLDLLRNGLCVSDTYRVVTAPRQYRQHLRAASVRAGEMRRELQRQRERRSVCGLLRRLVTGLGSAASIPRDAVRRRGSD